MRVLLGILVLLAVAGGSAASPCRPCKVARPPRCGDADAKHRVVVDVDFASVDGQVEVLSQTGLFKLPAADLDGKTVLFIFLPRGEVFQGFFEDVIPGSITAGTMEGTRAHIATGAVFPPGEYEMLLFIDVAAGGPAGPQRGDLAAFDNTVCDPTGVSVRVAVGCEDAPVTLGNGHFIIF